MQKDAQSIGIIFGIKKICMLFSENILTFFTNKFLFDNQRLLQIVLASEKQGLRVWNSLESMEIFKLVFQAEKKWSVKSKKNWKV